MIFYTNPSFPVMFTIRRWIFYRTESARIERSESKSSQDEVPMEIDGNSDNSKNYLTLKILIQSQKSQLCIFRVFSNSVLLLLTAQHSA